MHVGLPRGSFTRYSYSMVEQLLELPPGTVTSATLRFRYRGESDRPSYDNDAQYVLILNRWGQLQRKIMRLSFAQSNGQVWVESPGFDLLRFTWPLKVHFEVFNDGAWGTSRMYIDDVRVEICMGTAAASRPVYRGHVEVAY